MAVEFDCTGCGQRLRVAKISPGQNARCPQCGHVQTVSEQPNPFQDSSLSPLPNQTDNLNQDESPFREKVRVSADTASLNPYAPPTSAGYVEIPRYASDIVLAGRLKRLAGYILDGLIHLAGIIPGFVLLILAGEQNEVLLVVAVIVMMFGGLAVMIGNWVLITKNGQSYAKRILGMRIVKTHDGDLPGFLHGVVLRQWIPFVINQVCGLFSLVDALFIFGKQRQCLHDMIASTRVVERRQPRTTVPFSVPPFQSASPRSPSKRSSIDEEDNQ